MTTRGGSTAQKEEKDPKEVVVEQYNDFIKTYRNFERKWYDFLEGFKSLGSVEAERLPIEVQRFMAFFGKKKFGLLLEDLPQYIRTYSELKIVKGGK